MDMGSRKGTELAKLFPHNTLEGSCGLLKQKLVSGESGWWSFAERGGRRAL